MFNNKEEALQFAKIGLNQIRGFCKSFQTKIKRKQKKKRGKELEKEKGRRQHFGLDTESAHGPFPPSPETLSFSLSSCH
jgi:hypothetical protein